MPQPEHHIPMHHIPSVNGELPQKIDKRDNEHFQPLGTEIWESYSYFQAAVELQQSGALESARQMYLQALQVDSDNRGAQVNLAIIEIQMASIEKDKENQKRKYQRARARLEKVLHTIESSDKSQKIVDSFTQRERDSAWYTAKFQLIALADYQGTPEEAEKLAKALISELRKIRNKLDQGFRNMIFELLWKISRRRPDTKNKLFISQENRALLEILNTFESTTLILYATILASRGKVTEAKKSIQEIGEIKLSSSIHYGLSCYYAAMGAKSKRSEQVDNYEKALEHLENAFEQGENTMWAARDPSLEPLRNEGSGQVRERFSKLIEEHTLVKKVSALTETALPLANLALMGNVFAKKLEERGIISTDDLISQASESNSRAILARDIKVHENLLLKWVLLADMMRIKGITAQYANLLAAAGIDSLEELSKREADDLVKLLIQVNQAQNIVTTPLSIATIGEWINDAKHMKSKVYKNIRKPRHY